jgi:hypothetical protein
MVSVKFVAPLRVCAVLCGASKQAVNLSVHRDGQRPGTWISEILAAEASIAEI